MDNALRGGERPPPLGRQRSFAQQFQLSSPPSPRRAPPSVSMAMAAADPDGFHSERFDDRDIFGRLVAAPTSPRRPDNNAEAHCNGSSPRPPALSPPPRRPGAGGALTGSLTPRQSPTKMRPLAPFALVRPRSPLSEPPPDGVVTLEMMQQISPRCSPRRAILSAPDIDKITAWLVNLRLEERQFASFALYCEMLFRESDVLIRGKPVPNRLQTAIAFHCLCRASSVFARHEGILRRICADLGAAIYMHPEALPRRDEDMTALEFFARQTTYYDDQGAMRQERDEIQQELKRQVLLYKERVKEGAASLATIKDLEARYKIRALDKISNRNTAHEELKEKLHVVLQGFQYMDEDEKQKVVLSVIDALRAHISADTMVAITHHISMYEKDKLLRELFHEEINDMTEKIRSEVIATSTAQQNAILERSAARITRFQTLIWGKLRANSTMGPGEGDATAMGMEDDDLCDQDRKVLESISEMIEELQAEKRKSAALEESLREAEQKINDLRWRNNVQLNEAQDAAIRHAKELVELREEYAKAVVTTEERGIQTDRKGRRRRDGMGSEDDEDEDLDENSGSGSNGRGRGRRRLGVSDNDDDDLIVKNRKLNKDGVGIASIIEQARIPSSKIRKILSKRKPLTLNEIHVIIVGYYQAKMFQDIQDDNVGKIRSNLAQFIMDMYTLHYGLKDLAISQLVFLDASIRKHAAESARVRTFGLLTGSLEPDSHACSVQGIDFFLFVVVVMFNAGSYKRGRKEAVHVAQNLKSFFGEGIFMSPKSVTLRLDVVCTTIDLVFSFRRDDPNGNLDKLKDEIRLLASSQTTSLNGGIEVDIVLEKIMNYWFVLYEQQIEDIHAMFAMVDTNGDGSLDFREFCEVVQALEPGMDRRETLAIYNKAAGDDHVIDKDEFVQVMLAHQRGVILKEFYSGDSNKKILSGIQQRSRTYVSPTSSGANQPEGSHFRAFSGSTSHLDREESYASLMAAVNVVTDAVRPLTVDDDDGPDDPTQNKPDKLQDSVSFMTLSRLSRWASEAKGKLLNSRQQEQSPTESESPAAIPKPKTPAIDVASIMASSLQSITESSDDTFERDVTALLEQALSRANINLKEVV